MEYVDDQVPSLDVHYREWNYDGPTVEIDQMTYEKVQQGVV